MSYHKHTNQYYVTTGARSIYLGADKEKALKKYHQLGLGVESIRQESVPPIRLTVKDLANRFIAAQRTNWQNPNQTLGACRRTHHYRS